MIPVLGYTVLESNQAMGTVNPSSGISSPVGTGLHGKRWLQSWPIEGCWGSKGSRCSWHGVPLCSALFHPVPVGLLHGTARDLLMTAPCMVLLVVASAWPQYSHCSAMRATSCHGGLRVEAGHRHDLSNHRDYPRQQPGSRGPTGSRRSRL